MLELALADLEQAWVVHEAPIAGHLAPGISRDEAAAIAARHGINLPDDVAQYFGWHDGLVPERDHDYAVLSALHLLSLAESLELRQMLADALDIIPDKSPLLRGAWLPLLSDSAGEFLLVSCEQDGDETVYSFELEDPGTPVARFANLTAMARALADLHGNGTYYYEGHHLMVRDERLAEQTLAAWADGTGPDGSPSPRPAPMVEPDTEAVITFARRIAPMEGPERARTLLEAAANSGGNDFVSAAISQLDVGARDEIARSLGSAATPAAAPLLLRLLQDPHDYVRETATGAIGFTGDPAVGPALLPLLASKNHNIRKSAAFALGELKVIEAAPGLLPLTKDPKPAVRAAAVNALGKLAAPVDISGIVALLEDPYPDAAQQAAWALGELGDEAAIPALERATKLGDTTLARIARAALEALRAGRAD